MSSAGPGQQRPQKDNGRAHGPHQSLGDGVGDYRAGLYHHRVAFPPGRTAQVFQNGQRRRYIRQVGTVVEYHLLPCQQTGRQDGQHAVFRSVDGSAPSNGAPPVI